MGAIAQSVYSSRKVLVYFTEVSNDLEIRTAGLRVMNIRTDNPQPNLRLRTEQDLDGAWLNIEGYPLESHVLAYPKGTYYHIWDKLSFVAVSGAKSEYS